MGSQPFDEDDFDALFDDPTSGSPASLRPIGEFRPALGGLDPMPGADSPEPSPAKSSERSSTSTTWWRGWVGRPRGWIALGIVLVLVAVGWIVRLESEQTRDIADLPGGLETVGAPPVVRWTIDRSPGDEVAATRQAILLVGDRLTAYDPRTGARKWRSAQVPLGTSCLADVTRPAQDVIVCLTKIPGSLERSKITVVDSRRGTILARREVRASDAAVAAIGSRDLVRAVRQSGGLRVIREDAVTGEPVWSREVARREDLTLDSVHDAGAHTVDLGVDRGAISVVGSGAAAAFTEDGHQLVSDRLWAVSQLADGRYVGYVYGLAAGEIFGRDGHRSLAIPGRALTPLLDDGSTSGVIVATGVGGLIGLDSASGEEMWKSPFLIDRVYGRVGGRLFLQIGQDLTAIEVATGDVLWRRSLAGATVSGALTDGRVLVLSTREGTHGYLVGFGVNNGLETWRTALSTHTSQVVSIAGRLLVATAETVQSLG